MTNGQKVVDVAEGEVGVSEIPLGSNTGPRVREYQAATYLSGTGWPWCDAFMEWSYERAGVDHDGIWSPSTAATYERAKGIGAIATSPVPGAGILWPGVHVGMLIAPTGTAGVWHTIEGNSGDRVSQRIRSLSGAVIVVPPALRGETAPTNVRAYYLEDVAAEHHIIDGRWQVHTKRLDEIAKRRGGEVKRAGSGVYVIRVGQPRHYGPWSTEARQLKAKRALEERLGRRLRRYSKVRPLEAVSAVAESLGKTT